MRSFIFFDVGGTLLHFRPSFADVFGAACRELGAAPGPGGWEAAVAAARGEVGGLPDSVDLAANRRWWSEFYRAFLLAHGVAATEERVGSLWSQHARGDWLAAAEDAAATLERLARAGHRLGVISNWDDTLEEILRRRGLLDFFEVVVASSGARAAKPDAAIFHAALAAARVSAPEAVHVGDDPEADAAGARAVGIRPVLVGAAEAPGAAIERVASLSGLLSLPGIG